MLSCRSKGRGRRVQGGVAQKERDGEGAKTSKRIDREWEEGDTGLVKLVDEDRGCGIFSVSTSKLSSLNSLMTFIGGYRIV